MNNFIRVSACLTCRGVAHYILINGDTPKTELKKIHEKDGGTIVLLYEGHSMAAVLRVNSATSCSPDALEKLAENQKALLLSVN